MEDLQEQHEIVETETVEPDVHTKSWEEERAELAQKATSLEEQLHRERVMSAFYRKAIAAGVDDPDKLAGAVNLTGVTVDGEGNVQGIDEILSVITAVTPRQEPRAIGSPVGGHTPAFEPTKNQMLAFAAQKAQRTGRVEDVAAYTELKHKLSLS